MSKNGDSSLCLSQCLSELSDKVKKLESSRNNIKTNVDLLDEIVKDNSRNISEIFDLEAQKKNDTKLYTKDLTEKVDSLSKSSHEDKKSNVKSYKALKSKSKTLETKMKSSTFLENTESVLKNLGDDITVKQDTLNTTLQNSLNCIFICVSSIVKVHSTVDQGAESLDDQNATGHNQSRQRQIIHVDSSLDKSASGNLDSYSMKGSYIPVIRSRRPSVYKDHSSKHRISDMYDNNYAAQGHNDLADNQNRFRGVLRKKIKPYLLTGISLDSNKAGLKDFLTDLGAVFKYVKFVQTRREDCLSAQIVISDDQSEIVENPNTWPEGIYCRLWILRSDYYKQRRARFQTNLDL